MIAGIAGQIFRPIAGGLVQMKPLTVQEYHRLIKTGQLPEDTSIELINGFLTPKDRSAAGEDPMTIGDDHILAIQKVMRLAAAVDAVGNHLRIQQPVSLPRMNEPEPDASIAIGQAEDYARRKPRASDILCVIEVADSSLGRDRTIKLDVYARSGIQTYIIINLPDRVIEVHSQPTKASGKYRRQQVLRSTESLRLPIGKSKTLSVPVKQLLP
jgi:Uma2 family endonuclease